MSGFLRFSILVRNPVISAPYLVVRMLLDDASLTPIYATASGGPGSLFTLDMEPKFEPKTKISADAKTMRRKAFELEQMADLLRNIQPANTTGTLSMMLVEVAAAMGAARIVRPMRVVYTGGGYETMVIEPVRDNRYLASETYDAVADETLVQLCNDVEALAWRAASDIVKNTTEVIDTRGT